MNSKSIKKTVRQTALIVAAACMFIPCSGWSKPAEDAAGLRVAENGIVGGLSRVSGARLMNPVSVDFDGDGVPDLVLGAEDGFFYRLDNPYRCRKTGK